MILFPAIDIHERQCVRLVQGDYNTAHRVAEDPLQTAPSFEAAGAKWIPMVDLDGAREGRRVNADIFLTVAHETGLAVEVGGGIRDMATLDYYLSGGVQRCILGSVALKNPALVREAVAAYGDRIAVGIDARDGKVATEGWLEVSEVDYIDLARRMEDCGVRTIIYTDIARDGMLSGPQVDGLVRLQNAVSCNIVASGGIRNADDIRRLTAERLYGAICGKSLYSGSLDLVEAIAIGSTRADELEIDRFFRKSALIPCIVQEDATGEVLMLAYMNRGALVRTIETGTTWFWSRSRREYWNKGATSGHTQRVVSLTGDCDDDTLLVRVEQTGAACHTGSHSCFFNTLR